MYIDYIGRIVVGKPPECSEEFIRRRFARFRMRFMDCAWVTGRFHAEARNPLNNKKRNKNSSIIVTINANSISKPV